MPGKPDTSPRPRYRIALAIVTVTAVGALGALVLGEYEFQGVMPYAAGALFGLVLGEVGFAIGGRSLALAAVTAAAGAGGLLWAAWISSGDGLRPLPLGVWPAMALCAVAGASRTGGATFRSRSG